MGSIILTGISHGKHQFSLTYPELEGVMICMAHCKCGYEVEIINFKSYGGTKDLQKKWEIHIGTWKGWVQGLAGRSPPDSGAQSPAATRPCEKK